MEGSSRKHSIRSKLKMPHDSQVRLSRLTACPKWNRDTKLAAVETSRGGWSGVTPACDEGNRVLGRGRVFPGNGPVVDPAKKGYVPVQQ